MSVFLFVPCQYPEASAAPADVPHAREVSLVPMAWLTNVGGWQPCWGLLNPKPHFYLFKMDWYWQPMMLLVVVAVVVTLLSWFDKFIQIQRYINLAKCRLTKKVLLFLSTVLQAKQEATPVRKIWGEGWQIEDDKHQQTHLIQNWLLPQV